MQCPATRNAFLFQYRCRGGASELAGLRSTQVIFCAPRTYTNTKHVMANVMSKSENEKAITAIINGNFALAESIYAESYRTNQDSRTLEKMADIACLKVMFLNSIEQFGNAYQILMDAISNYPDNTILQELFCHLLHKRSSFMSDMDRKRNKKGRLILGTGTGRSGSTSLTALLQAQPRSYFSHEHPPNLSWTEANIRLDFHIKRFRLMLSLFDLVGDVSHWWLPHFEIIQNAFPDVKMIVTKRDLRQTVSSFLKIKGGERRGAINHWIRHDGSYWSSNFWDECYPKYEAKTLEEALISYWSDFYGYAENLQSKYPNAVRIVPIEFLSNVEGQTKIFEFLEIQAGINKEHLFLNKAGTQDGVGMHPNLFPV